MEWILLEAGVALFLAVFIVWFTTGGKRKRPPPAARPAPDGRPNRTGNASAECAAPTA